MRHSKRDHNEIIDAVDPDIADEDNEDQRTNHIDKETPIDFHTTEIPISASQPTSLPTSQPYFIQLNTSTEGEAQNSDASSKPNFMQDPQTRKMFRSLAIVALTICVKWLVIKYIRTTTAYRRRRADLLSQTEERGRRRRYRNAARRYRLNMWVRRQVRRVGVPGQRRNENGHDEGQGHGDAGGTADIASSANNRSYHHNHHRPTINGTSSLPTHSTRPPLMEDELLGFRRVLEYVGELIRGDIIYDSDSLSPTLSMDLEMGYGSDISMFDYNSDGANDETNGSSDGDDARRTRRNELMNIAWEYGYGPGRFATPPPSSIAQLTTFSSPRTSDEGSEGGDGGTPRVSVGSDANASDDGSSTTGVDGDSEGRNGRRDSEEVDLANMSVSDEGREETDMLIARAENIMAK
ncbi:RNA processing protein [Ascosphaera pollenicola]|nr:RNA processing protein [Ascosphaera pollenicola]